MNDFELVLYALNNTPSLIIDCANKANPHLYYPYVPYEAFFICYVIPVDAIYRFRDTLKQTESIAKKLGVRTIVITSWRKLFNYNNDRETMDVTEHSLEIIESFTGFNVKTSDTCCRP